MALSLAPRKAGGACARYRARASAEAALSRRPQLRCCRDVVMAGCHNVRWAPHPEQRWGRGRARHRVHTRRYQIFSAAGSSKTVGPLLSLPWLCKLTPSEPDPLRGVRRLRFGQSDVEHCRCSILNANLVETLSAISGYRYLDIGRVEGTRIHSSQAWTQAGCGMGCLGSSENGPSLRR